MWFEIKGAVFSCFKQRPLNFNLILVSFIHISFGQTLTFATSAHINFSFDKIRLDSHSEIVFKTRKCCNSFVDWLKLK